ncbi:Uncharacterised protein [Vibrio alginolyticus]|nr:Uncharacterised protein [Vibrio alginolyticus]
MPFAAGPLCVTTTMQSLCSSPRLYAASTSCWHWNTIAGATITRCSSFTADTFTTALPKLPVNTRVPPVFWNVASGLAITSPSWLPWHDVQVSWPSTRLGSVIWSSNSPNTGFTSRCKSSDWFKRCNNAGTPPASWNAFISAGPFG